MKTTIKATRILGTNRTVYSAWTLSSLTGNHRSITSIDGVWFGQLGTERITAELDALPFGQERIDAVRAYRDEMNRRAYDAILAEFPNISIERIGDGEIEVAA